MKTVPEIVRDIESNYLEGSVSLSDHVEFDMHDTIEKIEAYLNSKHISGKEDALGREKPFFNIVTAAANIWYRATDIDRKDIRILPDGSSTTGAAFIATVILNNWMKEARFGTFLNEWGRTLARYGSEVVKFIEKGGELTAQVIPWNRLIVDPIDFYSSATVEKLYLTPEQLKRNSSYDKDVAEALINAKSTRETLDGKKKDNRSNFIEVYEVHGEMPEALLEDKLPGDEDPKWETYVQQMHVISFVSGKDGGYQDYTLFKGRGKKHPYMITHLIPEDGRTLAIGAVENLFEAQWMVNHSQKNIKDTLDLASKVFMQTADGGFVGKNVLSALETGDILVHKENMPLTRVANDNATIVAFQNFKTDWQQLANEINSTPDSVKGNTLPSGTPYSLGAFLGAQANSLFEQMTENKGLYLEEMLRTYVLPFVKKQMDTSDEVVAILDDQGVSEIDAMFVPKEAIRRHNEAFKESLLNGEIPADFDPATTEQGVRADLSTQGNTRYFKPSDIDETTWKEALKDFEMKVIVEVTNENVDKQAVLTTLATLLQTVASNPAVLQDPNARMLFSRIVSETGVISPIQIASSINTPSASPPGGAEALSALTTSNGTSNA